MCVCVCVWSSYRREREGIRKWSQKQSNNINNAASGNNKNHFNDDASEQNYEMYMKCFNRSSRGAVGQGGIIPKRTLPLLQ